MDEGLMNFIAIVSVIISVILIIGTFRLFSNVGKIRKKLFSQSYGEKELWILCEIGKKEEAYEIVLRRFLEEVYDYKGNTLGKMPKKQYDEFKEMFAVIGEKIPSGYEYAFSEDIKKEL